MPIEAKIRTLKYSPDEIKAMIIENLGESAKDCKIEVRFSITHQYDALDRGSGTPVLDSVDVTITKTDPASSAKSTDGSGFQRYEHTR